MLGHRRFLILFFLSFVADGCSGSGNGSSPDDPGAVQVSSIAPDTGSAEGGTSVTIHGDGFDEDSLVFVGGPDGQAVVPSVATLTLLVVDMPPHPVGSVDISVRRGEDGEIATLDSAFEFLAGGLDQPVIASVTPAAGPDTGGSVITLAGQNFDDQSLVVFGGFPGLTVIPDIANPTLLQVTAPAHAAGPVDLSVVTGAGQVATLADAFLFEATPPPSGDTDGDGITNAGELSGYDILVDESGFGPAMAVTRHVVTDPADADTDGDGLDDLEEKLASIDASRSDTDGDGLDDGDEIQIWITSPVSVDTDGDARGAAGTLPPSSLLFDGAELRLLPTGEPAGDATSPSLSDTDGDNRSDYDELLAPGASAVIADLPRLDVEVVDAVDIRLNVEYAEEAGTTREYGTRYSLGSSSATSQSSAETTTKSLQLGADMDVQTVLLTLAKIAIAKGNVGGGKSWQTTDATTTTTNEGEEHSQYVSDTAVKTETVSTGSLSLGLKIKNSGPVAFTLTDLGMAVRSWEKGVDVADPAFTGALQTLATLAPVNAASFSLAPGQSTPVFQLLADGVDASRVKEFLRDPSSLKLEPAYYDLTNADGLNFAFISAVTETRTAEIIIDFGADDPGSGAQETYRVATSVPRGTGGTYPGVPLERLLTDVLQIPFTMAVPSGGTVTGISSVRSVTNGTNGGFWTVLVDSPTFDGTPVNIGTLPIRNGDRVLISFIADEDGDGLTRPEEDHFGSSDALPDTDGDGLTDVEEVRGTSPGGGPIVPGGWLAGPTLAGRGGYPKWVFSNPGIIDADGDGLSDFDERALSLDPGNPDTDTDGLSDDVDPLPGSPAAILYVKKGSSGTGASWATAYGELRNALDNANLRNNPPDVDPANDVSEVWVAQGLYTPASPIVPLHLFSAVGVYGGFLGTETKRDQRDRNPFTNGTVLSGDLNSNGVGDPGIDAQAIMDSFADPGRLDGFTLTGSYGGDAVFGGALSVQGGNLHVENVLFIRNAYPSVTGFGGGAIYLHPEAGLPTSLTVRACVFSQNSAAGGGGAILANSLNSVGNQAPVTLVVEDSFFQANTVGPGGGTSGGAIWLGNDVRAVIRDSTFVANQATSSTGTGSAIFASVTKTVTVEGCHFEGNNAGGVGTIRGNRFDVNNSTFWGNRAFVGAALQIDSPGNSRLSNSTVVANDNTSSGFGSIHVQGAGSNLLIQNSIIAHNRRGGVEDNVAQVTFSLSGAVSASFSSVYPGGFPGISNISLLPQIVDATTGDLRLQNSSPAIDAGNNFIDVDSFTLGLQFPSGTDIAGNPRIQDASGDGFPTIDMGAYEQ